MVGIVLVKICKIIVNFCGPCSKHNIKGLCRNIMSKRKQFSQYMSGKGISVMYLKVFFHQIEITRMDNNISKFFLEVPNHLITIYCCTHIHYDIDVFWIRRLCQLLKICKILPYCLEIVYFDYHCWQKLLMSFLSRSISTVWQPAYKIMIKFVLFWN